MNWCKVLAIPLGVAFVAGCESPPHHAGSAMGQGPRDAEQKMLHLTFDSMADNALLHNMAIADIHFVPHTDELNSLGVRQLTRLARLVESYGGTIGYETMMTDSDLIARRLEHAQDYLTTTGIDLSRITLTSQRSGGRGLRATDAIRILDRSMTDDASSTSGGTGLDFGGGGSSGGAASDLGNLLGNQG